MKFKFFPAVFLTAVFLGVTPCALGAVTYATSGSTYAQNFDSLTSSGTWTNNVTLAGWYARTDATATITSYTASTGSSTTAALYSLGVAGANVAGDRALGYYASNAFTGGSNTGRGYIGLELSNVTGRSLESFTFRYDGEEWRRADNTATQSLTVQYSLNATSVTDATATWTSLGGTSTFTSPQVGSSAGALDGNLAANRVANLGGTVEGINWQQNTTLWIRFVDLNDTGNDHLLAIDNVSFSAIPEPSSAALLGMIAVGGLFRRRR